MYNLDVNKKEPMYQQLYKQIKDDICKGELLAEEKLPSTRLLAEELEISRSTVDMAYGQLLSEGYIFTKPYKGYYVEKNENFFQVFRNADNENGDLIEKKKGDGLDDFNDKKHELEEEKAKLCDFSPNGIDRDGFPLSTWKTLYRGVLKDYGNQLYYQGESFGEEELREEIASYLYTSRGVFCNKDQIVVGAGNDYLLMLLSIVFRQFFDVIGMSNETYLKAYKIFNAYNMQIQALEMDEHGVIPEEFDKKNIQVLYTMPSHQFPSGTVMPIGRRMEILKWANNKVDRYIIEDDYDSEFRYKGRPIPALAATDHQGKVIYMGTFSKSLAPAIRISYMVLPQNFLKKFKEKIGFFSSSVSRLDQMTLYRFMNEGYFERHIHRMKKIYREKRDFLLTQLDEMKNDFEISGANAGLHLVLIDKKGRKEEALIEAAASVGVKVYGLSKYIIDNKKEHPATILIGYAENEIDEIESGIFALVDCWKKI